MKSGDVFIFDETGNLKSKYERQSLGTGSIFDEKWLQKVLFENIELIKVCDPVYDRVKIVPLCRELTLNDGIRNLFLDVLAVTETGSFSFCDIGAGDVPWQETIEALRTIEYKSTIIAEMLPWDETILSRTSAAMDQLFKFK